MSVPYGERMASQPLRLVAAGRRAPGRSRGPKSLIAQVRNHLRSGTTVEGIPPRPLPSSRPPAKARHNRSAHVRFPDDAA
jgi:hypothetical protein